MHEQQRSQDAEYTSSTEVDPNLYRSEVICRALLIQQIRPRYVLGHAGCIAPTWQRELLPVYRPGVYLPDQIYSSTSSRGHDLYGLAEVYNLPSRQQRST